MDGWMVRMDGRTDKYSGTDFNCTGWLIIQIISLDSLTVIQFSIWSSLKHSLKRWLVVG
jgi:hypothetical protein